MSTEAEQARQASGADMDQVDACHDAIGALRAILGELTGRCDPDPLALGNLRAAVGRLTNPVPLGAPIVVAHTDNRLLTVTGDHRRFRGNGAFPIVTVEDNWASDDPSTKAELDSSIPLEPDQAEWLSAALLAAAATARRPVVRR